MAKFTPYTSGRSGECSMHGKVPTVRLEAWRQDDEGHWVAVLSCGHTQHQRHQPPWQSRPWVQDPAQRQARLGSPFVCGWCALESKES
jgi:hypothetical protein